MNVRALPQVCCPECGADNNAFAAKCWICQRPLVDEAELVSPIRDERPPFVAGVNTKVANTITAWTLLAMVIVGFGVSLIHPILVFFYIILVCVPCLAVGLSLRGILKARDKPTATSGLTGLLIFVSVGGLMAISVGILFFMLCLSMVLS
ncbi:hypothetical protein M4951_10645 [Blastopirellula sp. J2-11]|uniref:hypothetical protein n=1 Tax=Blastopirellula sp. J2-11 TaxID=2943192 RepID=UPI0021C859D6|nr:hypothetical protein [Blastopirellula sp. J2-11]UUO08749.1 hypothetical protein M4951_10645 [Blastopirellula sp. J2-11]